jgi:hypothetical protein
MPVGSLTSFYTLEFGPLAAPGADRSRLGAAMAPLVATRGALRLDALDPGAPWFEPWLAGAQAAGVRVHRFFEFGNWSERIEGSYADWLARRPGTLRNTIRRRTRQAAGSTQTERVTAGDRLEPCIADFEKVYARSWKSPEPYADFNAACMRALAQAGLLRLGVLRDASGPIAAEYWAVSGGTAYLLKLAYDQAAASRSPGTVLTAQMVRGLFDEGGIGRLDFGRGDDPYKQLWVGERRERLGVLLLDPRRPLGMAWQARLAASRLKRRLLRPRA